MKSWRKYALCFACVCSMALLAGCGNDDNKNANEKETQKITAEDQKADVEDNTAGSSASAENNVENGAETGAGGDTAAKEENSAAQDGETDSNVNGVTDENNRDSREDIDAPDGAADNGNTDGGVVGDAGEDIVDGVGDAGKDVIDGVGDAGKDVIDGVEDAGDALTGNSDANKKK